jgi:hypothetical protein
MIPLQALASLIVDVKGNILIKSMANINIAVNFLIKAFSASKIKFEREN